MEAWLRSKGSRLSVLNCKYVVVVVVVVIFCYHCGCLLLVYWSAESANQWCHCCCYCCYFLLLFRKRQLADFEKPLAQKRGILNELRKKGSASALGNIFSGLMSSTTPSTSGGVGENLDPFETSCEPHPRKLESTTSSSSGMSSNGGASEISVPPTAGGSGMDDVDQGKSYRGHISLG